jgi:hypothetical protein
MDPNATIASHAVCGEAATRVGSVILSAVSSALGGHSRLCDLVLVTLLRRLTRDVRAV